LNRYGFCWERSEAICIPKRHLDDKGTPKDI
jgi:hypothetical protein